MAALEKQLNPFPDESNLSQKQKQKIIWYVTSIADYTLKYYRPIGIESDMFPVGEIVNPNYELQMSQFVKERDELYQEANRKFQKAHQSWEIEQQDWLENGKCTYCCGSGGNWTGESGAGTVTCYHCSGAGKEPEPKKPVFQEYEPKLIAPSPSLRVYGRIRLS